MTIFSGHSVISRVYTSRFGNGTARWNLDRSGTKKVSGTRYSTQWKTPQKWTVPYRTVPYHAVEKRHNKFWANSPHTFTTVRDDKNVSTFWRRRLYVAYCTTPHPFSVNSVVELLSRDTALIHNHKRTSFACFKALPVKRFCHAVVRRPLFLSPYTTHEERARKSLSNSAW